MKGVLFFIIYLMCLSLQAQHAESYGEQISTEGAISVDEIPKLLRDGIKNVKVSGTITATCRMKGCWMNISGRKINPVRVTFKDYGFFVPRADQEGKTAVVHGEVFRKEIDVQTLRHYAEDAGKSPEEIAKITEPQTTYQIIADGVVIYP